MSGPKTSVYNMTKAQRKKFEKQQKLIIETNTAQKKAYELILRTRNDFSELTDKLNDLKNICKESGMYKSQLSDFTRNKNEIFAVMKQLDKASENQPLEMIKLNISKNEELLIKIKNQNTQILNCYEKIYDKYKNVLSDIIADSFSMDFNTTPANTYVRKIDDVLKAFGCTEIPENLLKKSQSLKERVNEINNTDFMENFYSMQIAPFIYECNFYIENFKEYQNLLNQYEYLIEQTKMTKQNFIFSDENIKILKEEINKLQQIIINQKEKEYISNTIDEIMVEIGYELIGERAVEKKNGKKFKNALYTLDEGTAVNVTFSNSGQISMELCALDNYDRTPTSAEASALADDMQAFCNDYSELEKRLLERGIETEKIFVLPPSSEYAQIINTSDYNMKRQTKLYSIRNKNLNSEIRYYKEGE